MVILLIEINIRFGWMASWMDGNSRFLYIIEHGFASWVDNSWMDLWIDGWLAVWMAVGWLATATWIASWLAS